MTASNPTRSGLSNGPAQPVVGNPGEAPVAPTPAPISRVSRFFPLTVATLFIGAFFALPVAFAASGSHASADLDQCANGAIGPPIVPQDPCLWVNGNLNEHDSHYAASESVPYRMVLAGLDPGAHQLIVGFDVMQGGKHAIDYLTSPQRIDETVNPCLGILPCAQTSTFVTPPPAGAVAFASYNALPLAERQVVGYGATITGVTYLTQGDLTQAQSEATVRISFTVTGPDAVLAWGGHIADRDDWGAPNAAPDVSGSPYHMRLKSLDGVGGNQDRSLKATAIAGVNQLGASLTIVKQVDNQNFGAAVPADFMIHLLDGQGADAAGSPQPGDQFGTSYVNLPAGAYTVTEDPASGYAATFSGDCAADGSITMADGDIKTCILTNHDIAAGITVVKTVVNDDGGQATAAAFSLFVGQTQVPNGQAVQFAPGTYLVTESGPAGYAGTFGGDCDANGTVVLGVAQQAVCTLVNNDIRPRLTVTKVVVNDDGGTLVAADVPLTVDGSPVTSGQQVGLAAGTYLVAEENPAGYAASFAGDCDATGHVTLAVGDAKQCTITDDDIQPLLTVVKVFVNDNGGTAIVTDAALFVDGQNVTSGAQGGYLAGAHHVSEIGPFGYAPTFSGDCDANGTVVLALADAKTCIITNDDIQPLLTVTKIVINDNGGTLGVPDFPLHVGQTTVVSGQANGFDAASYAVGETGAPGYAGAITGDCDAAGQVVLHVGDAKACTITNDDIQPLLTVIKHVINDNGGQAVVGDFRLSVGEQSVLSGQMHGFDAGSYQVAEDGPAGYAATWSGDCAPDGTVTLAVGDNKTCILTNDDIQPILTVTKVVINDDGGTFQVPDWALFVGDAQVLSGQANGFDAATYHLAESGPFGYALSFAGDCAANGNLTLAVGDVKSCTMINDDIRPGLLVTKTVINDNGGTATANDWTFSANDAAIELGNWTGLPAGSYRVGEAGPAGYALSFAGDCDANGTVVLSIGVRSECDLVNDDIQPILNVTKVVINDDGGTAQVADWQLFVDLTQVTSGVPHGFDASALLFHLREAGPAGYALSFAGDCAANGTIALHVGDVKSCTMVNDDIRPLLTVSKTVVDDNGGVAVVADWVFHVGATQVLSSQRNGFAAGAYDVAEAGPGGYAATFAGDCDGAGHVVLHVGDNKTCLLTNDDIQPILTVTKVVINDDGGTATVADFPLRVGNASVLSGIAHGFDAATYQVSEAGPAGYAATFSGGCDAAGRITLHVGQVANCTLTNDDIRPVLTVTKVVINDNGGTRTALDWILSVGSATVTSGVASGFAAGSYQVSEAGPTGYAASFSGDCSATGAIVLHVGDVKQCTITNDDKPAILHVVKHVINDGLGTKQAADFQLHVVGAGKAPQDVTGMEAPGRTLAMNAGTFLVSEAPYAGYTTSYAGCSGTLALGDNRTCIVTNDDVALATRTQGYWSTHTAFTHAVVATRLAGTVTLGQTAHSKVLDNDGKVFGTYYSDIAKLTTGAKRTALDQARMVLAQQLLTTKLNCAAFGCSPATLALVHAGDVAFAGSNAAAMAAAGSALDAYNNSHDGVPMPAGLPSEGSATPATSKTLANLVFWNTT